MEQSYYLSRRIHLYDANKNSFGKWQKNSKNKYANMEKQQKMALLFPYLRNDFGNRQFRSTKFKIYKVSFLKILYFKTKEHYDGLRNYKI